MSDRDRELLSRVMQEDMRRKQAPVSISSRVVQFFIWMPILSCVAYGIIGSLFAPADVQTLLANLKP